MLSLIVKGNRFQAAQAAADRSIPAVFKVETKGETVLLVGDQHEVGDGCVPPGSHRVLRFDFVSQNVGDADFVIGRPIEKTVAAVLVNSFAFGGANCSLVLRRPA